MSAVVMRLVRTESDFVGLRVETGRHASPGDPCEFAGGKLVQWGFSVFRVGLGGLHLEPAFLCLELLDSPGLKLA